MFRIVAACAFASVVMGCSQARVGTVTPDGGVALDAASADRPPAPPSDGPVTPPAGNDRPPAADGPPAVDGPMMAVDAPMSPGTDGPRPDAPPAGCPTGQRLCAGACVPESQLRSEVCNNNQDDDCDGATDCVDADCATGASCGSGRVCTNRMCVACGAASQPCCGATCTGALLSCQSGTCTACGGNGQLCCGGATTCGQGATCTSGRCCPLGSDWDGTACTVCGAFRARCCVANPRCDIGFRCFKDRCDFPCGNRGEPCCPDFSCPGEPNISCQSREDPPTPADQVALDDPQADQMVCKPCGGIDEPCCGARVRSDPRFTAIRMPRTQRCPKNSRAICLEFNSADYCDPCGMLNTNCCDSNPRCNQGTCSGPLHDGQCM